MQAGLTIAFSTRRFGPEIGRYVRHLKRTCGIQSVEVLYTVNTGQQSLSELYNHFLRMARHDIVCLIHDDLRFARRRQWGRQLVESFAKNPDFAVFSPAGSVSLEAHGVYWEPLQEMAGSVSHRIGGKLVENLYSESFNAPLPALVLDGLMLAIHRRRITTRFDERITGFHFYDLAFSLNQSLAYARGEGGRCGVLTNLGVTHLSGGDTGPAYQQARRHFRQLYSSVLPAHIRPDLQLKPLQGLQTGPKVLALIWSEIPAGSGLIQRLQTSAYRPLDIQVLKPDLSWPDIQRELWQRITSSDAELILLLNGSVLPLQDWLPAMVRNYRQVPALGSLGVRLHYPDTHLLRHNGLQLFYHPDGRPDVAFKGIHSPYTYQNKLEWRPDGSPAEVLMLKREDFLSLEGLKGQDWVPGLELNLKLKAQARPNAVDSRLAGYWLGRDEDEQSAETRYQAFLASHWLNF